MRRRLLPWKSCRASSLWPRWAGSVALVAEMRFTHRANRISAPGRYHALSVNQRMTLRKLCCLVVALFSTSALGISASSGAQHVSEKVYCSYFVAPTGSDDNDGTSAATPFATLKAAQAAVRQHNSKTVCLRLGTYRIINTLTLTAADAGETWSYYPPDGVNSAVLDGGETLSAFFSINANNVTIDGLTMQHFYDYAIRDVPGHTNALQNVTIENCNIGYNVATRGFPLAVSLGNGTNFQILHNYVHNVQSQGIGLFAFNPRDVVSGAISGNVVLNAVQGEPDGGAVYVNMRYSGTNGVPAGSSLTITNNYVAGYGSHLSFASHQGARGIYLDDNTSKAIVSGNVIGPPNAALNASNDAATAAIFVHNGNDNQIAGNIIDLGVSGNESTVIWGYDGDSLSGMYGNSFRGNIVLSRYTGSQNTNPDGNRRTTSYFQGSRGGLAARDFVVENNVYFNYAGGVVSTSGNLVGDSHPILMDPQISGWNYNIASGSPVYQPPINFTPIMGAWGPPGFVVPRTGITPSNSH